MKKNIFLYSVLIVFSWACANDNKENITPTTTTTPTTCNVSAVGFTQQISPIFQNNCVSCHNNISAPNGINLQGYDNIVKAVKTGKVLGSIKQLSGFIPMPQGGKLSSCQVQQIEKWIQDGTPNN